MISQRLSKPLARSMTRLSALSLRGAERRRNLNADNKSRKIILTAFRNNLLLFKPNNNDSFL